MSNDINARDIVKVIVRQIHVKKTAPFIVCAFYPIQFHHLWPLINLLKCLFAEWTRYRHITRIEHIERAIDGQTPFAVEPPLKRVFPQMYRGNAIDSAVRSILNAFSLFKFGTTQKGDDDDDKKVISHFIVSYLLCV